MLDPRKSNRAALAKIGAAALAAADSPFKPKADAFVNAFRSLTGDLATQVRNGEMTLKQAREIAAENAARAKGILPDSARDSVPKPGPLARTVLASADALAKQPPPAAADQTATLIRQLLTETEIANRADAYRAATHRGAVGLTGRCKPVPNAAAAMAFLEECRRVGDQAGEEYTRRLLSDIRATVIDDLDPGAGRTIDLALAVPGEVSEAVVADYVARLKLAPPETREAFAAAALERRDASACVAAILAAQRTDLEPRLIEASARLPVAAVEYLAEAETLRAEAAEASAVAHAARAADAIDFEATLPGLSQPTEQEITKAEMDARRIERSPMLAGLKAAATV